MMTIIPSDRERRAQSLANLYRLLTLAIVERTDELQVTASVTASVLLVVAKASDTDYGRLLGGAARMFQACEMILRSSIFAAGDRVDLIVDCPVTASKSFSKFRPLTSWSDNDDQHLASLLKEVAVALYKSPDVEARRISNSASTFKLMINSLRTLQDTGIEQALSVWFTAVGRNRGRIVYLDLV